MQNLRPPKPCNGARLKVKALYRNALEVTILTGCVQEKTVPALRIPLTPTDFPLEFKFPLEVFLAMTINKSRGQTLRPERKMFLAWAIVRIA